MTVETCYDLASLTKVLATTTALVLLAQRGLLKLDDRIEGILNELRDRPIGAATVRHLLTHSSGLPGWRPYYERIAARDAAQPGCLGGVATRAAVLDYIAAEELVYERGTRSLYSDLGFMLLGQVVERLSGESLDEFCRGQIFTPLGASPLAYLPHGRTSAAAAFHDVRNAIAPTEEDSWRGAPCAGKCTMKMPMRWAAWPVMPDCSVRRGPC